MSAALTRLDLVGSATGGGAEARQLRVSPGAAFAAVLVAGAVLRLWLVLAAGPGFFGYPDAAAYVQTAAWSGTPGLFANAWRPAGYPVFLGTLHSLIASLRFVTTVQHLMGLLIAGLLYHTVADVVRCRYVALLPAAIVAFAGTEIYLEHSVLSETLYTTLVVLSLVCATRSLWKSDAREAGWLCAAGALAGLSTTVRSIGACALPVLLIWVLATRHGWRSRVRCAVFLALGMALPLGGYLAVQHRVTGTWGLNRTAGQTLYARAAIFADCRDFTPPAGTRALCQAVGPPRPGATWYMFDAASPQVRTMGVPPTDPQPGTSLAWRPDGLLKSFALRAITHQPAAFVSTTLQGLAKYIAPGFGQAAMLEWSATTLTHQLHNPQVSRHVVKAVASYYSDARTPAQALGALDSYADMARVEGPVTAVLVLLALGCIRLRDRRRSTALLFGAMTGAMMIAPVVMLFYGARYATPAYGPLAATAALGLDGLIGWRLRPHAAIRGTARFSTSSRSAA